MHAPDEGCTLGPGARLRCAGLEPLTASHRVIAPSEATVEAPLWYGWPTMLFGRRRQAERHAMSIHQRTIGDLLGWAAVRPDCEDEVNIAALGSLSRHHLRYGCSQEGPPSSIGWLTVFRAEQLTAHPYRSLPPNRLTLIMARSMDRPSPRARETSCLAYSRISKYQTGRFKSAGILEMRWLDLKTR